MSRATPIYDDPDITYDDSILYDGFGNVRSHGKRAFRDTLTGKRVAVDKGDIIRTHDGWRLR